MSPKTRIFWHYPLIRMHLKCKNRRGFWRKQRLEKCPNGQVTTIFARSTVALALKAQKNSEENGIILLLACTYSAKTGEDFSENSGPKSARTTKLWQFWQGHPKPAFSKKVQRRDPRKLFKNRPKSSPRLKGPKALWRKWHYPRTSMHLKCKHWRRF